MSRSHLARTFVLGIALTLASQSAWAAPRRTQEDSGSAWNLVTQLWHSFSWSEVGCIIDPHGGCGTAQELAPPSHIDEGCWLDPNGGCGADQASEPPSYIDEGCWIDPNGGCRAGG
jgi:hypothetical protein